MARKMMKATIIKMPLNDGPDIVPAAAGVIGVIGVDDDDDDDEAVGVDGKGEDGGGGEDDDDDDDDDCCGVIDEKMEAKVEGRLDFDFSSSTSSSSLDGAEDDLDAANISNTLPKVFLGGGGGGGDFSFFESSSLSFFSFLLFFLTLSKTEEDIYFSFTFIF